MLNETNYARTVKTFLKAAFVHQFAVYIKHTFNFPIDHVLPALRSFRREEVVLARLRIGHTWLTHAYLLKSEEVPKYIPCFTQLSVQYILLECADFATLRDIFVNAQSMRQLFESVKPEFVLDFLREINILNKI